MKPVETPASLRNSDTGRNREGVAAIEEPECSVNVFRHALLAIAANAVDRQPAEKALRDEYEENNHELHGGCFSL
jgi:hypothetical protein